MERVNNIFNRKSYFRQYSGAYACFLAQEELEKMGFADCKALSFNNGILKIKLNNFFRLKFSSKKEELIENINKLAKKSMVKNIMICH